MSHQPTLEEAATAWTVAREQAEEALVANSLAQQTLRQKARAVLALILDTQRVTFIDTPNGRVRIADGGVFLDDALPPVTGGVP